MILMLVLKHKFFNFHFHLLTKENKFQILLENSPNFFLFYIKFLTFIHKIKGKGNFPF